MSQRVAATLSFAGCPASMTMAATTVTVASRQCRTHCIRARSAIALTAHASHRITCGAYVRTDASSKITNSSFRDGPIASPHQRRTRVLCDRLVDTTGMAICAVQRPVPVWHHTHCGRQNRMPAFACKYAWETWNRQRALIDKWMSIGAFRWASFWHWFRCVRGYSYFVRCFNAMCYADL